MAAGFYAFFVYARQAYLSGQGNCFFFLSFFSSLSNVPVSALRETLGASMQPSGLARTRCVPASSLHVVLPYISTMYIAIHYYIVLWTERIVRRLCWCALLLLKLECSGTASWNSVVDSSSCVVDPRFSWLLPTSTCLPEPFFESSFFLGRIIDSCRYRTQYAVCVLIKGTCTVGVTRDSTRQLQR